MVAFTVLLRTALVTKMFLDCRNSTTPLVVEADSLSTYLPLEPSWCDQHLRLSGRLQEHNTIGLAHPKKIGHSRVGLGSGLAALANEHR